MQTVRTVTQQTSVQAVRQVVSAQTPRKLQPNARAAHSQVRCQVVAQIRSRIDMKTSFHNPADPKLAILVVTHGYPLLQQHGAEQQVRRKVAWWTAQGHSVQVVAADPQPPGDHDDRSITRSADRVDGVTVTRYRFAVPDGSSSVLDTFDHPQLRVALERDIRAFAPDVVYQVSGYIFGVVPMEVAASLGIPSVLFATDFWHVCQRLTMLRPDGVCCPGPRHPADCSACRLTSRMSNMHVPDTARSCYWHATAASGRYGIPISRAHRDDLGAFQQRASRITAALASASLVVVNSAFLKLSMLNFGVPESRILCIRQGIDRVGPLEQEHPEPGHITQDGLRLLYLGQVARHKGVDLLIRAVTSIQREGHAVTLRIHGQVTDQQGMQHCLRNAAASTAIVIGDPLDRSGVDAALSWADVLVVPSRWYENSPNVILEAQAAGTPVITCDHGGMAEMVRHNVDGLLVEPGSKAALEAALRRTIAEPDLIKQFRRNIRQPHSTLHEMTPEDAALTRITNARHVYSPTSD
jgi:glycosyltransferase involved in cell wall biosynthesis